MSATAKSSSYWAEAMASDGFLIECVRTQEGEWFNIISREPTKFDGLRKIPVDSWQAKTSSPFTGLWVIRTLTEVDGRSKLTQAGLSTDAIKSTLEWARRWVTTITSRDLAD